MSEDLEDVKIMAQSVSSHQQHSYKGQSDTVSFKKNKQIAFQQFEYIASFIML